MAYSDSDYYAILGVSRDASSDDIRTAFLRLSRAFHPDKQPPASQNFANEQYPLIDQAYKVLSVPTLRQLYDDYGSEGIEAVEKDNELMTAIQTQVESNDHIRHVVHEMLREQHLRKIHRRLHDESAMELQVDARDFVQNPLEGFVSLFQPQARYIGIDRIFCKQSTQILSKDERTEVTIGGQLTSTHGISQGTLDASIHHTLVDHSVASASVAVGSSPHVHLEFLQRFSKYSAVALSTEIDDHHGFDIALRVNQVIGENMQGSVLYGPGRGMHTSVVHQTRHSQSSATVALNRGAMLFSSSCRYRFSHESTGKIHFQLAPQNESSVQVSGSRVLSARSRLSVGVAMAKRGISLQLSFARGSMRFVIPILLCPFTAQSSWTILASALTPVVLSAAFQQLVKPRQLRFMKEELAKAARKRQVYLQEASEAADSQQQLMKRVAESQCKKEKAQRDGLVILVARYGENPSKCPIRHADELNEADASSTTALERSKFPINTDVTIPLKFLVKESRLVLPPGSKEGLLGFYNPCFGQAEKSPELYIRYALGDTVYELTLADIQQVVLPSRFARPMGQVERLQ